MIEDHAPLSRAVREQRLYLTRHVQPSRLTWADGFHLGVVVLGIGLMLLGVGYLAGAP